LNSTAISYNPAKPSSLVENIARYLFILFLYVIADCRYAKLLRGIGIPPYYTCVRYDVKDPDPLSAHFSFYSAQHSSARIVNKGRLAVQWVETILLRFTDVGTANSTSMLPEYGLYGISRTPILVYHAYTARFLATEHWKLQRQSLACPLYRISGRAQR
jgi:hypothetical protein